ncbi:MULTISPECIES: hypothetical protein [unclassified Microcoleus]|nr:MULTISPECIES: hypothetical protein [unclassified Microcoleus]
MPGPRYAIARQIIVEKHESAIEVDYQVVDISPCLKARGFTRPQFKSYRC